MHAPRERSNTQPSNLPLGSMADIAFLLLIFFLVSTDIQQEAGLPAVLPPEHNLSPPDKDDPVLPVVVNAQGQLLVQEASIAPSMLADKVRTFLAEAGPRSGATVDLQVDRKLNYAQYVSVFDAIHQGFNRQRDEFAQQTWGNPAAALEPSQSEQLYQAYPKRIRETVR